MLQPEPYRKVNNNLSFGLWQLSIVKELVEVIHYSIISSILNAQKYCVHIIND